MTERPQITEDKRLLRRTRRLFEIGDALTQGIRGLINSQTKLQNPLQVESVVEIPNDFRMGLYQDNTSDGYEVFIKNNKPSDESENKFEKRQFLNSNEASGVVYSAGKNYRFISDRQYRRELNKYYRDLGRKKR